MDLSVWMCLDGWMDEWVTFPTLFYITRVGQCTEYIRFVWMTGWMDVCVCIDGWIDVLMDVWMDGWMAG